MTDLPNNPLSMPRASIDERSRSLRGAGDSVESDELLLRRVREKDQNAMTILFDRYGGLVYSVAMRVVRDPASAEDGLQDVFVQLWRTPDSFLPSRGSLGAWLLVVTRNRAIDVLRRRRPTDSIDEYPISSNVNLASEIERSAMMQKV